MGITNKYEKYASIWWMRIDQVEQLNTGPKTFHDRRCTTHSSAANAADDSHPATRRQILGLNMQGGLTHSSGELFR